jgi:hypothetical protein
MISNGKYVTYIEQIPQSKKDKTRRICKSKRLKNSAAIYL